MIGVLLTVNEWTYEDRGVFMAEGDWLTVSDVSDRIGVPVETLRRYLRNHGIHLKVKKVHKRYLIHADSVTVLKQIRDLYSDSKNLDEVEQTLSNRGIAMNVTVQTDDEESVTVNVADELKAIKEALAKQQGFNQIREEQHKETQQVLGQVLAKLGQLESQVEESLNESQKRMNEYVRLIEESNQAKLETAAATQTEVKKKGLFSRLFGKK